MKWIPLFFMGLAGNAIAAPSVPPFDITPQNLLANFNQNTSSLTPQEQAGIELANRWLHGTTKPVQAADGAVVFFYGQSLPTVVCTPLKACDIQLEPGERITKEGLHAGDTVRWSITPTVSGSGAELTTHVLIKPTDVGLDTTLQIYTNRRAYHLKLVSQANSWMPIVRFDYPQTLATAMSSLYQRQTSEQQAKQIGNGLNIDDLDFGYHVEGKAPFAPVRVYNNSLKTILEMPRSVQTGKLPSLLVVNAGRRELINYRYRDGKFIVDGLPEQFVLVLGAGKYQQSVLIKREI